MSGTRCGAFRVLPFPRAHLLHANVARGIRNLHQALDADGNRSHRFWLGSNVGAPTQELKPFILIVDALVDVLAACATTALIKKDLRYILGLRTGRK